MILRTLSWIAAGGACASVFMAWLNPHLTLEVASFIRSCF
jgi:hypothetical protein